MYRRKKLLLNETDKEREEREKREAKEREEREAKEREISNEKGRVFMEKENHRVKEAPKKETQELKCPKCASTNLTANTKGFGLGKAAVGGVLLGPVGLLGGLVGSKKAVFICLKCGNQFQK